VFVVNGASIESNRPVSSRNISRQTTQHKRRDENEMKTIRELLDIPAANRAKELESWLSEQTEGEERPRELAETLAAMANEPYRAEGSNADNAQIAFIDAERLCYVLDDAAEKCAEPRLQAELWTHVAWSALITGQLADLPYAYAKRAVRANPGSDEAWAAYAESIRSENTDFFDDAEALCVLAKGGELPADVPRRIFAAARSVCEYWDERDLEHLEELERRY
jgi:hypothetical protein